MLRVTPRQVLAQAPNGTLLPLNLEQMKLFGTQSEANDFLRLVQAIPGIGAVKLVSGEDGSPFSEFFASERFWYYEDNPDCRLYQVKSQFAAKQILPPTQNVDNPPKNFIFYEVSAAAMMWQRPNPSAVISVRPAFDDEVRPNLYRCDVIWTDAPGRIIL